MDGLLDGSDELHLEILSLLEGTPSFPGIRFEVAYVACAVALEHALSLRLLVRTQCYTSAIALMRLQFEALTRGMWLLYAASDAQVEALACELTLDAEREARKVPMLSQMLEVVVGKAPDEASRMLLQFKEVNWHGMNSFVHSGIHPLQRHIDGYPQELIENVVRNSNGLNTMTGMLGAILTGDPQISAEFKALQVRYRNVLPDISSPSE